MDVPKIILLIENSRRFGRDLLQGIARYAELHGPWSFYRPPAFYLNHGWRSMTHDFQQMLAWNADGIIMRETENTEMILQLGLPTVISTWKKPSYPGTVEIYVENTGVGQMAAEHLLGRGFKNFAFCGFEGFFWSEERARGFRQRIQEAGFKVDIYRPPAVECRWVREQARMIKWLQSLPKPVGLMACIDERAQNVIEACTLAGIHIPEEIALVSGDNDELICALANPPISSVAVDGARAGFDAAAVLRRLIKGEMVPEKRIHVRPTHVATRKSTDILAIEDPEIANAIRFIRQNIKKGITANDVVANSTISRCGMYQRFQKVLGRSIHDEINRTRSELLRRMVETTDMTIAQIAKGMGFSAPSHVSRFFLKQMGMPLHAYRQKFCRK